jgi:hypothetical protein
VIAALLLANAPAPATPVFDPSRFFAGATRGDASLKIILRSARAVHVQGHGRVTADGTLILDQRVEQEGKAPRTRRWRIRAVGQGRYAGTLTDATGPVTGEATGNRLHLSYSNGRIRVDQWLTLSADGRSARNRLVARRFGITLARLDETIRKLD